MEGVSVWLSGLQFSRQPFIRSTSNLAGVFLRTQGSPASSSSSWDLRVIFILSIAALCRLLQHIREQMKKDRRDMLHCRKLTHFTHQAWQVYLGLPPSIWRGLSAPSVAMDLSLLRRPQGLAQWSSGSYQFAVIPCHIKHHPPVPEISPLASVTFWICSLWKVHSSLGIKKKTLPWSRLLSS